jgi:hypothetical protein
MVFLSSLTPLIFIPEGMISHPDYSLQHHKFRKLVVRDVLFHRVNVISTTRERIYVFLLEIAAALVWNKMSLTIIILFLFLLECPPPGLRYTGVKHPPLFGRNVHPLPTPKLFHTKPSIVAVSVQVRRYQSSNVYFEKSLSPPTNSR